LQSTLQDKNRVVKLNSHTFCDFVNFLSRRDEKAPQNRRSQRRRRGGFDKKRAAAPPSD